MGWYDGFVGWAQTVDWQAWGLFANAAAILTAAIIAARTASSVFKSKSHSKVFDLSERIMFLVYGASEVVQDLRPDDYYLESFGDELHFQHKSTVHIKNRDLFDEIRKNLPLAKAFLDDSVFQAMSSIVRDYDQIGKWLLDIADHKISNLDLGEDYSERRSDHIKQSVINLRDESEAGVYCRIQRSITTIERILIPILKAERKY
ncbi:hypothetical protein AB6B38_07785 [Glycocaulis abyssi]|uniref:Uncharacterized protein n=1 Tax=Glycocaulis abyssi TaxID=1433403 RepID=A0ABV9N9M9_9PROT